jgi:hypothetical protein
MGAAGGEYSITGKNNMNKPMCIAKASKKPGIIRSEPMAWADEKSGTRVVVISGVHSCIQPMNHG